jgi:hypothetical protein
MTRLRSGELISFSALILVFRGGNFHSALDAFDRASKLSISFRSRQELSFGGWQTLTRSLSSLALAIVGYLERARLRNHGSYAVAAGGEGPLSAHSKSLLVDGLHLLLREPATAHQSIEESLRVAS